MLIEKISKTPPPVNSKEEVHRFDIVWKNIILFSYMHAFGVAGFNFLLKGDVKWETLLWGVLGYFIATIGTTAGAHRHWAHRSYKATLPLKIILMFMQTFAFQNSIHEWVRDHRVHHKHSETDADPHNAKRGFFFSHIGWLLVRKHPLVKEKGRQIDMSDLENDPIVAFQAKHYGKLVLLIAFAFPVLIPVYFWREDPIVSWCFSLFRYCITMHVTFLVNSAAHIWGSKPYDTSIQPAENRLVTVLAVGEGWHNYHHVFPWDYKASELGHYGMNFTTAFIDFFAKIGWAYDLKTVPKKLVEMRRLRTGVHEKSHSQPLDCGDPKLFRLCSQ